MHCHSHITWLDEESASWTSSPSIYTILMRPMTCKQVLYRVGRRSNYQRAHLHAASVFVHARTVRPTKPQDKVGPRFYIVG